MSFSPKDHPWALCAYGESPYLEECILSLRNQTVRSRILIATSTPNTEICRLAGIEPSENIYPPVVNDSKRIDYYTTEYGIGYKGSW